MSKAAERSVYILIFLLLGSLVLAGMFVMEKQKIEQEKIMIETRLSDIQEREEEKDFEIKKLKSKIEKFDNEKDSLKKKIEKAEDKVRELLTEVDEATMEKDKWKRRIDSVKEERDNLVKKVQDVTSEQEKLESELKKLKKTKTIMSVDRKQVSSEQRGLAAREENLSGAPVAQIDLDFQMYANEDHWAEVLKEKASLEIQVEKLEGELSEKSISISELEQKNSDMHIELKNLQAATQGIVREIKYKEDLVNNLSLQLARVRNNKKFSSDRITSLNEDNRDLRQQIQKLVSSKTKLSKAIIKIKKEKDAIEKQLVQREGLIQGKIDEIWEIKESLDKTFQSTKLTSINDKQVELTPIVVRSDGSKTAAIFDSGATAPDFNGEIVSINKENNFVIVNIGEKTGVSLGTTLSVYRGGDYIARLKVIQVRPDILAADIKEQKVKIEVGDIVK